jgi:hypothetical protein
MLLMLACGAFLAAAVVAAWLWRDYTLEMPQWAARGRGGMATALRALVWFLNVGLVTGLLVGVFVVGPTGRLAMRLLAVTSPQAQGELTEAKQVIGQITLEGTAGFFFFVGLPFGLAVGITYAFASFVLPRGLLGGAIFGAAVLVIFGSVVDPLRGENPDFDVLGSGWLAVMTFSVMAVLTGLTTAAIAGRLGAALGVPKIWWTAWLVPVGLAAAAALIQAPPIIIGIVVSVAAVFVGALLVPPERRGKVWARGKRVLQGALAAVVVVMLPGFVSALSSIVA